MNDPSEAMSTPVTKPPPAPIGAGAICQSLAASFSVLAMPRRTRWPNMASAKWRPLRGGDGPAVRPRARTACFDGRGRSADDCGPPHVRALDRDARRTAPCLGPGSHEIQQDRNLIVKFLYIAF